VTTVLADPELRDLWVGEVAVMRDRINGMRRLLVDTLAARGVKGDFDFMLRQHGMFSLSGLTEQQVKSLRERYAIYVVNSGRINVAGVTPRNVDRLCQGLADVLAG